ncbi:Thioredoxin domain-containing protein [Strigomonas culicis]|uniref:Thioredoxin domain-containing protein n=1 Tax=Strigomonas culicis TaxID=28005 RepID=S9V073_9TRYP|nr:Thioredoxin domain-containing protein [Strigomonas culicis]EPY34691.1 Thioredoxin domain-containing protein [Strigomonas culicis]|eukprot:EPY34424.1 Thioredoxin domain-containing protein [Strigomonas culicis]
MLGSGKSSGVVNEASNLKANQNLTNTIEQMSTKAYMSQRDPGDVIPTHQRKANTESKNGLSNYTTYDPEAEKAAERVQRGGVDDDDDEDMELLALRRARMQRMKMQTDQEAVWRGKQHGEYREIGQDDFFNIVVREKGGSDHVVVHFYHKDFESCKQLDYRLSQLARQLLYVRFVKIDAERSPFLVERLRVMTLPCCLLFKNDVCIDRILGFEGCVGEDGLLDPELLRERIERTMQMSASAAPAS